MPVDWKLYKDEVIRLYVDESKTIEETLQYLQEKLGLQVTPKQFKSKFGGLKNLRAVEWKAVIRQIHKRAADGKLSDVYLNGRKLDPKRVMREIRRYSCSSQEDQPLESDSSSIDLGVDSIDEHRIEIRTPVVENLQPSLSSKSHTLAPPVTSITVQRASESEHVSALIDTEFALLSEVDLDEMDVGFSTPRLPPGTPRFNCLESQNTCCLKESHIHCHSSCPISPGPTPILGCRGMPSDSSPVSLPYRSRQLHISEVYPPLTLGNTRCSPEVTLHSSWKPFVISSIIPNTGIPGVFCTPEELLDATWGQLEARVAWGKSGCLLSHMISTVPKLEILKPIIDAMEDILRIVPSRVQSLDYRRIPDMTTHQADQMFATVAYLAINNQLDDYHLGHFFRWVINEGLLHELSTFIRAKSTNVCVFSARLLRAMFFGLHPFDDHFTLDMLPFFEFLLSVANLPAFSGRVGGELLHRLAGSHNVEVAKLLVAGGADVDYVQWMDIYVNHTRMGTPLCHAVIRNNIQMVSLFISAGSDINKRVKSMLVEGEEETALIMAIRNDSYEAAMVLLEAGAEFDDSICVNGYSAVEYAKMNSRRIHEALLKKRRSSRAPDIHQLVLAAEKGGRLLSAFVLENNIVNEEVFERALRRAVKMGAIGAVRTLLNRGVDPDARLSRVADNVGGDLSELEKTRPILVAAGLRDAPVSDIVYLLIKAGAEVNDDVLMQICHLVARNNKGVFRVLREAGCNVSVFGPSAVESFAHDRKIFECALYLDIGAPINEYGVTGLSALQVAAFCHMPSDDGNVMHFLLDRGADVNLPASVDGGMTALQAAAWGGSTEVVDALIDAGANVRAPPARNRGFTVLEAAARACNLFQDDRVTSLKERELVLTFRKLLALGAPVNRMDGTDGTLLHDLIRRSRIDCLKLALQAGARVEDRDPGERAGMSTPLQVAAAEGQREALQLLLDNGADVNAVAGDEFGRTALQAATSAATSDPGIVAVLLAHNADINASPARKGGVTALQGAAIRGDLQIARMLLLSGADVNAAAALEEGRTALEGAAEHGRLEMMTLLLSAGATADPATGFSGAIRLAEDNWHFFIANLLREHEQLDHFLVAETGDSFWFQNNTMFTQGIILPENEG